MWHPISISGYHIREAGSTAAQELAFTLKNGFTYVEWALERGLDVDGFAPRLSFFFNAHLDFFEEIAKYRAARRIWARELRDRYGARDERSLLMRFHTQTAGVSLTWQQPLVNVARTAIEALAAVLGGTQSLHTNSYDEALALPTEDAVRLALRTQQVIAHETGVVNTIDPLGGSYHVEALTNRLEAEAYELFRRIDELGGMVAAIEQNMPQREIADAAYRYQQEVEAEQRVVVGVNRYQTEHRGRDPDPAHRPRPRAQADRTAPGVQGPPRHRRRRAPGSPSSPRPPALPDRNLMPVIVDAAATASPSARSATPGAPSGAPGANSRCSSAGAVSRSALRHDLELHPVVGELDAVRGWELRGAVRQQQPARAGRRVRLERLVRAQVAARLAVRVAVVERRLTDEEVGVASELRDALARAGVTRVRERRGAVRHAEPVRLEPVVRQPDGEDVQSRSRPESLAGVVLVQDERALEHVGEAEARAELLEEGPPAPVAPRARTGGRRGLAGRSSPRPTARGRPSGRGGSG